MDLAALLAPRDPEHQLLAAEIFAEREDLQQAFGAPDSAGFRQWLAVHGRREFADKVARFYPPVPPHELRVMASCGTDEVQHLQSGVEDFRTLAELYEVCSGRSVADLQSVLDFGCGCGRLLQWFAFATPAARLYGLEVRQPTLRWVQDNLRGDFRLGGTEPPSELPAASMDLITAMSVFSHLSRPSNLAWIRELRRLCKPEGIAMVTAPGAFALAAMLRSKELRDLDEIDIPQAGSYLRRLEREHFVFHQASAELLGRAEGVEEVYGQTFFDAAFVRAAWGDDFELLACVPAAHVFLQDVYVLRAR